MFRNQMKTSLTNDETNKNHKISFYMMRVFIKISKEIFIKAAKNIKLTSGIEQPTAARIVTISLKFVITFV